jgi:dienelactone hydrolase
MRVLRFLFYTVLVAIGLAVAGVAAIWALNPFAPEVVVADPSPEGRRVTENGLLANYYPPQGEGKHPGVLMLGGSEGGLGPGVGRMAKALQAKGFAVLHVSYFAAPGQPAKLELVPLETFDRALDWLKAQAEVDAGRLAVVGGSKGAEAALIVATRHPDLRAAVECRVARHRLEHHEHDLQSARRLLESGGQANPIPALRAAETVRRPGRRHLRGKLG